MSTRAICLLFAGAALFTTACGPRHIEPFTPRHRLYKEGDYAQKSESARPAPNGPQLTKLDTDAQPGSWLRVGDRSRLRPDLRAIPA